MIESISGQDIWALIDGKRSVDEIAHELSERMACNLDDARQTVKTFIERLHDAGLVQPASDADESNVC